MPRKVAKELYYKRNQHQEGRENHRQKKAPRAEVHEGLSLSDKSVIRKNISLSRTIAHHSCQKVQTLGKAGPKHLLMGFHHCRYQTDC